MTKPRQYHIAVIIERPNDQTLFDVLPLTRFDYIFHIVCIVYYAYEYIYIYM